MSREVPWVKLVMLGVLAALVIAVVAIVRGGTAIPDEVQPIAWHHQACAHCGMLVAEPAHAAQLITADGDVLSYDDPGCALRHLAERRPSIHRLWFHHGTEDRWLAADQVGFRTGATTPMGSGLIAVDRAPDTLDLAGATRVATEHR